MDQMKSKGLDALEHIKDYANLSAYDKDVECIEKELKEYEEMKAIKGTTTFDKAIEDTLITACPNVAKKLKALEIIKEKRVDIGWLIRSESHSKYNLGVGESQALKKTQYDLLKEVLL